MDDWAAAKEALAEVNDIEQRLPDEEISPTVQRRIEAVEELQAQCESMDEEYYDERRVIERKRDMKRQEYYRRRASVISGCDSATEQISAALIEEKGTASRCILCYSISINGLTGIPKFWLLAFGNHPVMEQLLTAEDIPVLQSLIDVNVQYDENYTSFRLNFVFLENEYFTNQVSWRR
jgi:hypothetical protein